MRDGYDTVMAMNSRALPPLQAQAWVSPLVAAVALVLLMPLLLAIGAAVLASSAGPVLVKAPHRLTDGRLMYLTTFRVFRTFDAETHDCLARKSGRWLTPLGAVLRATRFERLPVLLDVRAGRVGFAAAWAG